MSKLNFDSEQLAVDAKVTLFQIELPSYFSVSPNKFYFVSDKDSGGNLDIMFRGITYVALPIEVEGFDLNANGTLPSPKITIANVNGIISNLCTLYDDLKGSKVTRITTYAKYLDRSPEADPNAFYNPDIFYVAQKALENKKAVSFQLNSSFDLEQVKIPGLKIQANYCTATYRDAASGCPFIGAPTATELDVATTNALTDKCGHRLSSCILRFGSGTLPFNGFPGSGRN